LELEGRILFEDNHLIVVSKIAGELIQGDQTGDVTLAEVVKEYLKKKYKKTGAVYLGIVHRLDRPTSGVVVFARTSKALSRLNEQFKRRIPKKTYWALVDKSFPQQKGSLTHWMTRNSQQNKSKAHSLEVPNSKKALLHYNKIQEFDRYSLVEIELETGRHHQIRAQLCTIGFPIQGDLKYGAKRSNKDGSISLHAQRLELEHPVKKDRMIFLSNPMKVGLWKSVLSDLK